MPNNWKTYKLEDALEALIDYRGKTPKKTTEGIPLVTAKIVKQGRIQEPNEFIAKKDYIAWMRRGIPNVGDVVLTTEAPLGEVAQISDANIALAQRIVTLRGKVGVLDNGYLKYYLLSTKGQARLAARQSGTTVFGIKQSELRKVEIDCPTYEEQRAIASILSAIDDKIELNIQMNNTLEEMAMTLYKHWFVDFGPFQNGEFVDSELGMIPKGWEVKCILDIATLLSGGTPKTMISEYWDGNINWVSAKDIGNGGNIYINDTEKKITEIGVKNSSTKILPEDTVILVARGSVGKYGMIAKPMAMNQSCYGLYTNCEFSQSLVYLMCSMLIEQFQRVAYGSVFDTITTSTFNSTKVISPPKEIVCQLKDLIDPLFLILKQNTIENQSLNIIRDTLLPKLISGEVRVKEAEKIPAETI